MPKRDVKVPAFIWAVKTSIQALCDYFAHLFVPVNFPSHEGFFGVFTGGQTLPREGAGEEENDRAGQIDDTFQNERGQALPGTSLSTGKAGAAYAWEVFLS